MKTELKDYIGKQFKDKKWGDTIIEIIAVSNDQSEVRYKYIKIRGKDMTQDGFNTGECKTVYFLTSYERI